MNIQSQIQNIQTPLNKLRKKYLFMKIWAYQYNIIDFPESLDSLTSNNPTRDMIIKDMLILSEYSSHPAYNYLFPGYDGTIQYPIDCRKEG
jgi:hypothetical protein